MGITERGRIAYINKKMKESDEDDIRWNTWYLNDNQMKMWIINFVSNDILSFIFMKEATHEMWIILEQMYGEKIFTSIS